VSSTGLLEEGRAASPAAVEVLHSRGIDIAAHRSRVLAREQIERADLVLAMERAHVRESTLLSPSSFTKIFTLKELVRRAETIGPRLPNEDLAQWVRRAGLGRRPTDHLGTSNVDDVADPIGQPADVYDDTARELDDLLERLVKLAWPAGADTGPGAIRSTA
jgi:protein-tyrosine-phosphatase